MTRFFFSEVRCRISHLCFSLRGLACVLLTSALCVPVPGGACSTGGAQGGVGVDFQASREGAELLTASVGVHSPC